MFAVIWSHSKLLDNPDNIHVLTLFLYFSDMGPVEAAGQPGQHPRADLQVQGDGQQLRHVPQPRQEVPVRLVRGEFISMLKGIVS
jgi:hypothetical protein